MKKQIEQQRDELAKECRMIFTSATSSRTIHESYFKKGFNAAEPIIRADERERILGLLRSEEAMDVQQLNSGRFMTPDQWAEWISGKLKSPDTALKTDQ